MAAQDQPDGSTTCRSGWSPRAVEAAPDASLLDDQPGQHELDTDVLGKVVRVP